MNFRTQEEIGEARVATLLYLPRMLEFYEEALKALGVRIVEKFHYKTTDGFLDPGFVVESGGRRFELQLGNAFKEFLSIDRDDKPMRFDYKLKDMEHYVAGCSYVGSFFFRWKKP